MNTRHQQPETPNDPDPPPPDGAGVDLRPRPEIGGWRLLACAVLLNAGISAVVAAGFAGSAASTEPRIATVRLADLVAARVDGAAREDADAEDAARAARDWALALEEALAGVAEANRLVILPARSVAAGAVDITGWIETEVAGKLEREPLAP